MRRLQRRLFLLAAMLMVSVPARAITPPVDRADSPEFLLPELAFGTANAPMDAIIPLLEDGAAWRDAMRRLSPTSLVHVDPRTGVPTGIIATIPLLPGDGLGNTITLAELARRLGRPSLDAVDAETVVAAMRPLLEANAGALRMNPDEVAQLRAERVSETLWQVSAGRAVSGVPVRGARFIATISHGNLVLMGATAWGRVATSPVPATSPDAALSVAAARLGGPPADELWLAPELQIVPVAPRGEAPDTAFAGLPGTGLDHRLAWRMGLGRLASRERWEALVDAHDGRLLAFTDANLHARGSITGGAYPITATGVCLKPSQCGTLQPLVPMPHADTGLPPPHDFTNSAGTFEHVTGTVRTRLSGRYVRILDECGALSESSAGPDLLLGGRDGDHDCVSGGVSAGNTAAARTGYHELNRLIELAQGWLPFNRWIRQPITATMNIADTCNAFYSPVDGTVNFFRSGGGCRNTGELAAVFDHEWGHALDDHDAGGVLSSSSEGYADIVAAYRLRTPCIGHGFYGPGGSACGLTNDGTGRNVDEDPRSGFEHCATDCSGVRDADFEAHAEPVPQTASNHICVRCPIAVGLVGPCGRQVHCAAGPTRQAAWDLVTRDLARAPFTMDAETAFALGNRLLYQGSGNVGLWHACDCATRISNGCNADSGYLQWLVADDDNGSLLDGTPHATALFDAFDRHAMACPVPLAQNAGCAGAPSSPPALVATPGDGVVDLTWAPVAGATRYWVLRTDGHEPCELSKALVATVTEPGYTDADVANGRPVAYVVIGVAASDACIGPASACVLVTPGPCVALLAFDRGQAACGEDIGVTLRDDSAASGSTVVVRSLREPAGVTVTLAESPPGSGRLAGTVRLTASAPAGGDGLLSVWSSDRLEATFTDTTPCGGGDPVMAIARADASCDACAGGPGSEGPGMEISEGAPLLALAGGDGDEFLDNCETAVLSFEVRNTGAVALTNVRVQAVMPLSGGLQIESAPPLIAASLDACASATGTVTVRAASLAPDSRPEVRVEVTADELAALGVTRNLAVRLPRAELDLVPRAAWTFSFEADAEGWSVVEGTFDHAIGAGASGTSGYLASSSLLPDQCDRVRSPRFRLTAASTVEVFTAHEIEPCAPACFDRAHLGLIDAASGARTVVVPDSGHAYAASGSGGGCVTQDLPGWAGSQPVFAMSGWSAAALGAPSRAGEELMLEMAHATDTLVEGTGLRFDQVTLTDVLEVRADAQPDACAAAPPGEPSDLRLRRVSPASVELRWLPPASGCGTPTFAILQGSITALQAGAYDHAVVGACGLIAPPAEVPVASGAGAYYLVVADNGAAEGSLGADSRGRPRPAALIPCHAFRDLASCP